MRDVNLRPAAERDIEDITDYTLEQWGLDQARQYVGAIRTAVEGLSESGLRHPIDSDLCNNIRRMRTGHRVVYFQIDDTAVDVIRILHERMDADARVKE